MPKPTQASRDVLQQPGFRVAHGKCMHRLASVLSSIRPFETDKPMRLRARCVSYEEPVGAEESVCCSKPSTDVTANGKKESCFCSDTLHVFAICRCLTVAIQAGLALLSMSAPGPQSEAQMLAPGSHLLVFTGGPITKGEQLFCVR